MFKIEEFQCTECDFIFEEYLKPEEETRPACPKCKALTKRVLGIPSHGKHSSATSWRMGHGS